MTKSVCVVRWTGTIAAILVVAALVPSGGSGAAPPDRDDPCSRAGRDVCGTLGVGRYETYRYGLRWFGDYRGAVPGEARAFCLDLGYWYASPGYRYRATSAAALRNRLGKAVPLERRRRIAYAIWRYGRSDDADRQAAVMLYVHAQMGDARPGEIDPGALGPAVATLYRRIDRDTPRFHGPYRIETSLPERLLVGRPAAAIVRVVSARGRPMAGVRLSLSATGAGGVPDAARTNDSGLARVRLTPTAAAGLRLQVTTEPLAAPQPHVFAPTAGLAVRSGQRLAVPAAKAVSATVTHEVGIAPKITTEARPQLAAPGAKVTDTVTVSGLGGASVPVEVALFGPFERREDVGCTGTPFWTGSFTAGNGTTTTAPVVLERAGYYVYRASIPERPPGAGFVADCGEESETIFVQARPSLSTTVSKQVVRPGARIVDRVSVEGLGKTPATIEAELFGPFATRASIRCVESRLRWSGRVAVQGSGTVETPPVVLRRAGFYGYRERLVGTPLVAGATTPCAPEAETTLVAPEIVTGGRAVGTPVAVRSVGGETPVRIRIAAAGVDAPVVASGIDVQHGVLGIPSDIHRVGWWRDGRPPGAATGSVLVAGHVDSARGGPGVFFRLGRVGRGDLVRLTTASGRTFAYRVAAVRSYRKRALPTSVFSRSGRPRLVLVTCGGPFDAKTGHYRDVVVVTARPV